MNQITGVELDFVVSDSRAALALYEKIFEVERIEVTDLPLGQNEAVFTIYGTRFHMLDENSEFQMNAPRPGTSPSFWFNVAVPDIGTVYGNALSAGCGQLQPVTEIADFGVSNAMFSDPFGYLWMLHQIHREIDLAERMHSFERSREGSI